MEVKKGYKQTEIGVIPEDWDTHRLQNNIILKARIGWQGLTTNEYLETGDYCLVTGTDFINGYVNWESCVFVEKIRYDQDKNIQLKIGDVLATKDGTIGKVAYVDNLAYPTTLNSGVFVLRPKNGFISNRFFYYILMSFYFDSFLNVITAGSTITHLYQKDFIHFSFHLPPLPEQKAIATALSDMDALIAQTEKMIEKKKAMKQGMMQELLKPKKGWVTKKLGEIGFTYGGITGKSKIDFEHGESKFIPFLNVLNNTILDTDYLQNVDIKPNEIQNRVQRGDLFFNGSSETPEDLGLCSVLDKELEYVYLNSFCFGFRFYNSSISGKFLAYFFRSHFGRRSIFSLAQGATRYNLSKTNFLKLDIPLPDKNEQDNIVSVLIDIDDSISISKTKLHKLKLQKQGMMQELLTGRIRLL
jgi:type I restriction enzyme S subunit